MSRARVVSFFATKGDLVPGMRAIEARVKLKLVEDRYYDSKAVPIIESLLSIPGLGEVSGRTSPRYIVLPAAHKLSVRRVVQIGKPILLPRQVAKVLHTVLRPFGVHYNRVLRGMTIAMAFIGIRPPGGRVVYEVCHVDHPSSIVFAPGGLWDSRTLIGGEIATMHNNAISIELYTLFRKELLRGFTTVKSVFVGPQAIGLLKSGGRLTVDVKAAPICDLAIE